MTFDRFMAYLSEKGIATGMQYIPNHLYDMYKPYYTRLPVTERVWERLVTLPISADITNDEVEYVIQIVRAFEPKSTGRVHDVPSKCRTNPGGVTS